MAPTLAFAVRRRDPELVGPAAATPRETKRLSDIDDQEALRVHVRFAFFYRGTAVLPPRVGDGAGERDPAGVLRRALGEALVQYYPLAGRLREVEGRKLVVDCTGEGVQFVEADADVRLAELEDAGLTPPLFPYMDQLLVDVEGSGAGAGVLHCPLLRVQVTRLLCGGFVLALAVNHTMCDAIGLAQFINAVAELAGGVPAPTTIAPVWSRELLDARSPPKPVFPHREFDLLPPPPPPPPPAPSGDDDDMVVQSFSFRPVDIAAMKKGLPPGVRETTTTFEALTACLWRARTAALEVPEGEEMRLLIIANFRAVAGLDLPAGYYGNACVPSAVLADAAALRASSLEEAVALVRQAKAAVSAEYVRSTADVLVLRGRPLFALENIFLVSDHRHAGFHRVDLGWGAPVYGGSVDTLFGLSFFIAAKNRDGEEVVTVPMSLPRPAMERFAAEMEKVCLCKA